MQLAAAQHLRRCRRRASQKELAVVKQDLLPGGDLLPDRRGDEAEGNGLALAQLDRRGQRLDAQLRALHVDEQLRLSRRSARPPHGAPPPRGSLRQRDVREIEPHAGHAVSEHPLQRVRRRRRPGRAFRKYRSYSLLSFPLMILLGFPVKQPLLRNEICADQHGENHAQRGTSVSQIAFTPSSGQHRVRSNPPRKNTATIRKCFQARLRAAGSFLRIAVTVQIPV